LYYQKKEYAKAIESNNNASRILKEIKLPDIEMEVCKSFTEIYTKLGNYESALKYHRRFSGIRDSLFTADTQKQFTEMQTKYESDKQQQQIELLNKDKALKENQINQQRTLIFVFVVVSVVILVFLVMLFRLFNQKKKANLQLEQQNEEIKFQHDLISEQKKEITDSIHYARRIQTAILPPVDDLMGIVKDMFILYKPRDIVSGDFYWVTRKENTVVIAVADCTGHGVPGAFMSMLGVSFLNEIVNKRKHISNDNENQMMNAADILNQLRESVIKSLHQTGKYGESKDGMDIALCVYNDDNKQLQFAGANNPMYIVQNLDNKAIEEIKADKMPIGIYYSEELEPFTNKQFKIQGGETIYLFSDGLADQFGGPDGKKYKYKQLKDNLLANINEPMEKQKELLDNSIVGWMNCVNKDTNTHYEQIDDILIIGFRL
jgi:serine phosphatase RsbU (regulator of sigma subunit)